MTSIEKIGLLVETINKTVNLLGGEFNKNNTALSTYELLYGKEKLQQELKFKNDLDLNPFYDPAWVIKTIIDENKIDLLEVNNIINKIEQSSVLNWTIIFLIEKAVERGDLIMAKDLILNLPDEKDGPARYQGERLILRYYAANNDLVGFKESLKKSKPNSWPKNDVIDSKKIMIENYSRVNDFNAGIELCKTKIFGSKFSLDTLQWKVPGISLNQIAEILESNSIYTDFEPNIKAILFVKHFNSRQLTIHEKDFQLTLNEIMKVDVSIKFGDGRLRDGLLCDLGSSTLNHNQILECKKHIKANFYKRELNSHISNIEGKIYD
jgi:hypothetical protein